MEINKKNDLPLVSIIVPVFNTGKLITEFIESITSQTYTKWELILVDDGSDETTIKYIDPFVKKDKRIIFFKRDRFPKGSVTCRNIGMQFSKGKYIIHFDADDIVESFCLEQRVSFMESDFSLDFAVFRGSTFSLDENGTRHIINRRWGRKKHSDDLVSFLTNDYPFSVWNCIFRTKSFKNILWDENVKIYTDFSYILPILIGAFKYSYCGYSKDDYLYRVNQKNAMTSSFVSQEKYESTIYLFNKTHKMLSNLENSSYYTYSFKMYHIDQFERILCTNNKKMLVEFKKFFSSHYGRDLRISALLGTFLFFPTNNKKLIRLVIALLFRHEYITGWISRRLFKK